MRDILIGILLGCMPVKAADTSDPVVIVYPHVHEQYLTLNQVRAIFSMRLHAWPDGAPIKVFVLKDRDPIHIAFCKKVLNVFPHQLRWAWDRLVYSGTGQAPFQVDSEEKMRAKVASTPGSVGYLRRTLINGSVRVLPVE